MIDAVLALELVPDSNTRFLGEYLANDSKICSPL